MGFGRWCVMWPFRRPCTHPENCRDTIYNGLAWVILCGLCGHIHTVQEA